ncbi:MAG TPA: glycosyltransferase family 39 protein, partial [Tepidisphaeraceae bacterium]|nr:glycosyltransferase family 39 protein [Tepidisphaeraceae bacterium]
MRCRAILAAGLVAWVLGNVAYLHWLCPYDLSGDEAHYWDWSRRLALSYYSKGPLVAYLIRASCATFGDTMQAVRYPAVLCSTGTLLLTYLTARRLFASDRLALGATAALAAVPVLLVGSVLMTIDPPMLTAWAAATYFAVLAIFGGKRWAWVLVGVAVGIGFLAKYSALLWFVGLLGFLWTDARTRRMPRTRISGASDDVRAPESGLEGSGVDVGGPLVALGIALLFTIPVIWWNHAHGWVSLRHVAKQTGASSSNGFLWASPFEVIGTQLGAAGPGL